MTTKQIAIAALVLFAFGVAFGRYTVPEKVRIETKIVEVEKKTEDDKTKTQTDTDRDRHRETTVTEVVKPDGTRETVTHTVDDTNTNRHTNQDRQTQTTEDTSKSSTETKEITRGSSPVTVSALFGTSLSFSGGLSLSPIVYGGSISRPILGPITSGLFGLSTGTFGVSVGLTF